MQLPSGEETTRVSAVLFGNSGTTLFHLNEYYEKEQLIDVIRETDYPEQNTNISGAIKVITL